MISHKQYQNDDIKIIHWGACWGGLLEWVLHCPEESGWLWGWTQKQMSKNVKSISGKVLLMLKMNDGSKKECRIRIYIGAKKFRSINDRVN